MPIPRTTKLCSGVLCGLLSLVAGCGNPSSENLNFLTVTPTPATVSVGGAVSLHATVHLSNGQTQDVTSSTQWTLSDPALATLGNGVLTSKAAGTLTVQGAYVEAVATGQSASTTESAPQNLSSTATVRITAASESTPTITWNTPAAIQYGTALSNLQLNATASVPGSFAYAPAAGTVLPVGSNTLTATFTPSNTAAYSVVTSTVQLTVTAASVSTPTITWKTPAPIQYGTALSNLQLNATASVPGNFAYTPAAGTVLPVGSNTLTATFTPADTSTYSAVTSTVQLTVTTASVSTPTITWNTPAAILYGTPLSNLQLNATASVPGGFVYTPAAGTVLLAGTQTLTATFTPSNTATYSVVTSTVQLTVTAASLGTPTITWNTPAAIQYGTALSTLQLNATASVPGSFVYTPAAGTVLPVGSQTLTARFTPSDTATYSAITSTVPLTITPANPVITWPPLAAIQQGTALGASQLDATANVQGTFTYSPAAGALLQAGTQELTATFTPSNTTDYTPVTAHDSLTVNGTVNPTPTPAGVAAFVQSFGINTNLSYPGTPYYGQPQSVISALQYLGINTIRDQPPGYTNDPTTTATDNAVAIAGVQFDAVIRGNGNVDITGNVASAAAFEQSNPGVIAAIEGPNEINVSPIAYNGNTDTYSAGVQVTQALWTAVGASPSLKGVPIYALTLATAPTGVPAGETALGNLAPYVTYGNAHIYADLSNNVWQYDMPYWLPVFEEDTPGMPMVITETGYATVSGNVDEISAAKYNLNTLFENALNGIARTYLFDLVDFNSSTSDTTSDDHFGQFYDDWTPKAGATAIHNLTTILQTAGSGTASAPFSYSVSGLPATGHTFLLGSSTAFDLAVWIDATIYDPTTATDIAAPAYSVTVDLGATFAEVAVYDPMIGTTPVANYSNVSSLSISVTDHPLIVQVN